MKFVNALPADKLKVGSVFYVDGLGYAVVVLLAGTKLGKAYTAYKRPLVLMREGDVFKVYPQMVNDGSTDADAVLGPVCERLEFEESDKVLSMSVEDNWQEILGDDAHWKLTRLLVDALSKQLHTSQLTREERKWGKAVVEFRTKQKPLRVNGKIFKPKASRFVCGYEKDGKRHLIFVKKITDVIYRVTQDITQADAPYIIEECNDDVIRVELQKAVREHLIPMAAYDFLFGKSSERTVQVSGQIPVDLHERMKWGGFSLPQVIQAGIQALEDGICSRECKDLEKLPKVIKGTFFDETKHQMLRALLLDEEF